MKNEYVSNVNQSGFCQTKLNQQKHHLILQRVIKGYVTTNMRALHLKDFPLLNYLEDKEDSTYYLH